MTWLIWMFFDDLFFSAVKVRDKDAYVFSPPNLLFFFFLLLNIVLQFRWKAGLKMNWISKFLVVLFFWQVCCVQLDNHEIIIMIQRAKTSVCAKIHMINVTFLTQNVKYFLFVLHHNLPLILKYLSLFNYFFMVRKICDFHDDLGLLDPAVSRWVLYKGKSAQRVWLIRLLDCSSV